MVFHDWCFCKAIHVHSAQTRSSLPHEQHGLDWSVVIIQFRPLSSSLWFSPTLPDIPTQSRSALICLYLCIFFPSFPHFLLCLLSSPLLPLDHVPD